jgi:hypothetical protein
LPADGISLPFTISGNVGSSRPEEQLSCRECMTHRPSKRPHFAARPLPPSADIGPGVQSVGQAAQFCLADSTPQHLAMLLRTSPPFIEPCLPSPGEQPPTGPDWVHEIKHDGYRLMARRDPVWVGIRQERA